MSTSKNYDLLLDVIYKLSIASFFLLLVYVVPLPGDRGPYLNKYWPIKEKVTVVEKKEERIVKQKIVEEDPKEIMRKAIKKVYGRDFNKQLIEYVYQEASKNDLEGDLIIGLIAAESSFRPSVKSSVGAIGYAQVWPKWHQDKIKGRDILNPYVNIEVAAKFLRECFDKNDNRTYEALACYNGSSNNKPAADRYYQRVTHRLHELNLTGLEIAGI